MPSRVHLTFVLYWPQEHHANSFHRIVVEKDKERQMASRPLKYVLFISLILSVAATYAMGPDTQPTDEVTSISIGKNYLTMDPSLAKWLEVHSRNENSDLKTDEVLQKWGQQLGINFWRLRLHKDPQAVAANIDFRSLPEFEKQYIYNYLAEKSNYKNKRWLDLLKSQSMNSCSNLENIEFDILKTNWEKATKEEISKVSEKILKFNDYQNVHSLISHLF